MDVTVGSIIGALVWYLWFVFEDVIELWTLTPGWQGSSLSLSLSFLYLSCETSNTDAL